jgi:hypothetical protein
MLGRSALVAPVHRIADFQAVSTEQKPLDAEYQAVAGDTLLLNGD